MISEHRYRLTRLLGLICVKCKGQYDMLRQYGLHHPGDCPGWIEPVPYDAGLPGSDGFLSPPFSFWPVGPPEEVGGSVITQNWEQGLKCTICTEEIALGEQMLYGRHISCARGKTQHTEGDPVTAAEAALEAGGRVAIPKAQLRALALLACRGAGVEPVRRPDRGMRGVRWYARTSGWSAERIERGLSLAEVAGLWLDILDGGRTPPVSHDQLRMLLDAISAKVD